MLSIIKDHMTKESHYPWEFNLNDLSISFNNDAIIVVTPNSDDIGVRYQFIHNCTKSEFLVWFKEYHNDKFRFMRNFKEIRGLKC